MTSVKRRDYHNEDVSDRDDASCGQGKPAGEEASQKDDRDHQRERSVFERSWQIAKWSAFAPQPGGAKKIAIDHQADADHHAGYKAGHEKSGNRDIADRAVNH